MSSSKYRRPRAEDLGRDCVDTGRRRAFGLVAVPVVLLAARAQAEQGDPAACVDLEALPPAQQSLRRSLGFKLQSEDPDKRCEKCVFFKPTGEGDCGKCDMFSGGIVTARSVCNSWSPS